MLRHTSTGGERKKKDIGDGLSQAESPRRRPVYCARTPTLRAGDIVTVPASKMPTHDDLLGANI